jgi:DNA-binding CsgD family transcriptional regulator
MRESPLLKDAAGRSLSGRQAEVLIRVADGMSTKAIARALGLSKRTVEAYRAAGLRALVG